MKPHIDIYRGGLWCIVTIVICDNGNYKMGTLTVDPFCQGSKMGKHYSVNKLKDIKGKS